MGRIHHRAKPLPSEVALRVAPRDLRCQRFRAQVFAEGRIAFTFDYRLATDLTISTIRLRGRSAELKRLASWFGRRKASRNEGEALVWTFLRDHANQWLVSATASHVSAAARAGQLHRISNALAAEHALLIRKSVQDVDKARLLSFELLEEVSETTPYHWTQAGPPINTELPDLSPVLARLDRPVD